MRRLPILFLGLAALALVSASALWFAPPWTLTPARTALRVTSKVLASVVPSAWAQDVLEFKPIPPESAAAMEARRARRRAQREAERARDVVKATVRGTVTRALPVPPAAPVAPDVPAEAPEPPAEPTRVELSRSGNIMRVGNDITIEEDQTVVGDVLAVGGDVNVIGHVEGDVVSMGGDIHLESSARVDGDVVCMGGQLHEEDGAVVGGQRVTAAGRRDLIRKRLADRHDDENRSGRRLTGALIWALITLGVAWAFTTIAPGRTGAAVEMMRKDPGASTLVGFLALLLAGPLFLVIIILGALVCITIIGIPLALAAWCAYGLLTTLVWIWGYVVGVTVIGQIALARRMGNLAGVPPSGSQASLVRAALFGVAIFSGAFLLSRLFKLMPGFGGLGTLLAVLSWIGTAVFTMVGAGALIRGEWQSGSLLRRWRRQPAGAAGAAGAAPAQWYPSTAPPVPPAAPILAPEPPPGGAPPPMSG